MATPITAAVLYDLIQCPQRVALDLHGDQAAKDPVSLFVQMLWERGALFERQTVEAMESPFLDLSQGDLATRQQRTLEAMQAGEPLIYQGVIAADGLRGIPDLLRREGQGYTPIDIKSGRGKQGDGEGDESEGKPKPHYAAQLSLYVDVLERLGFSAGRTGLIWDVRGAEVTYRLDDRRGPRAPLTLWQEYGELRERARAIVERGITPKGALASVCKLCVWRSVCGRALHDARDLSLIAQLGRAARDALEVQFPNLESLAESDPDGFIDKGKTAFRGVGEKSLRSFHARARLLCDPRARPYLSAPIRLPSTEVELFFDIEDDPFRGLVYLHGVLERRGGPGGAETFHAFFAEDITPAAEAAAFAQAYAFLSGVPGATVWFYSAYERTAYRRLQRRHPQVCTEADIERLFDPACAVDLYNHVVIRATEWPTHDRSIKTLASFLGFDWRDLDPSGAASIEWFHRWIETGEPAVRQRILHYNEDDCRATRVLLDGIRALAGG